MTINPYLWSSDREIKACGGSRKDRRGTAVGPEGLNLGSRDRRRLAAMSNIVPFLRAGGFKQVSKAGSNLVELPLWNLVVARDDGEDWSVGMCCPCGCGPAPRNAGV